MKEKGILAMSATVELIVDLKDAIDTLKCAALSTETSINPIVIHNQHQIIIILLGRCIKELESLQNQK